MNNYRSHEEIDSHTAAFLLSVADADSLVEIPLEEINTFLEEVFYGEKEKCM